MAVSASHLTVLSNAGKHAIQLSTFFSCFHQLHNEGREKCGFCQVRGQGFALLERLNALLNRPLKE